MDEILYHVWFDGINHVFNGYIGQPPSIGSIISLKGIDYRVRKVLYILDSKRQYEDTPNNNRYIISVKVDVEQE
jgi:hypothetical protein